MTSRPSTGLLAIAALGLAYSHSIAKAQDAVELWLAAGRDGVPCGSPSSCAISQGYACVNDFCAPAGAYGQACRPDGHPRGAPCDAPWSCNAMQTCTEAGALDQPCRGDFTCDHTLYCDRMGLDGYAYCRKRERTDLSLADRVDWSVNNLWQTTNFMDASHVMAELSKRVYQDSGRSLYQVGLSETAWINVTRHVDKKDVGSVFQIINSPSFGTVGGSATADMTLSAQALVATNWTADAWLVAVRGSSDLGDALTDLNVASINRGGIDYHQGFFIYASALMGPLLSALNNCQDGHPVWLTGHSLGGAAANILAYWLAERGCNVSGVITFGAPAAGSPDFARAYRQAGLERISQRWVNRKDPVGCLPLGPRWGRVGNQDVIDRDPSNTDAVSLSDNDDLCDGIGDSLGRSAYGYFLKVHDVLDIATPFEGWLKSGLQQAGLCYSDSTAWRIVLGIISGGASELTCKTITDLTSAKATMDQIIRLQSLLLQDPKNLYYHQMSWYLASIEENVQ